MKTYSTHLNPISNRKEHIQKLFKKNENVFRVQAVPGHEISNFSPFSPQAAPHLWCSQSTLHSAEPAEMAMSLPGPVRYPGEPWLFGPPANRKWGGFRCQRKKAGLGKNDVIRHDIVYYMCRHVTLGN